MAPAGKRRIRRRLHLAAGFHDARFHDLLAGPRPAHSRLEHNGDSLNPNRMSYAFVAQETGRRDQGVIIGNCGLRLPITAGRGEGAHPDGKITDW